MQEALTPGRDACNPIVSEGDTILKASTARTHFGINGAGVKVGVLSDSFDANPPGAVTNAAADVAHGELPGAANPCGFTTPVDNALNGAGFDEGRAMAQAVHSLAPGAAIAFETANATQTAFANNITDLRVNHGAKIIVDDVFYFAEPFYQDGPVAVAVNGARAAGVAYFSSAGNSNLTVGGRDVGSYEALAYRPTTCPALPFAYIDCHNFNSTGGTSNSSSITIPGGATDTFDLQWAQPWGGVTTDYDLFIMVNGVVVSSSTSDNMVTQKPFEFAGVTNNSAGPLAVQVVIARFSGPGTRLKVIPRGAVTAVQFDSSNSTDIFGPTIFGHHGAASSFAVAAADQATPGTPEPYTSKGPVTLLFQPTPSTTPLGAPQVLAKPDFTAVDCTQNSFFFPGSGSPHRFCGTSAAAPHAAAVAALMLQAKPTATPTQIGAAMASTAVPVGAAPAAQVGAGLLNADAAVAALLGGLLSITTTSLPDGATGAAYSTPVNATGGTTPYTFSISAGALPNGLTINPATGVISGTPTTVGTSNFTVKVKDSAGTQQTATKALSITITSFGISTTTLPTGTLFVPYSATMATVGGTPPVTWSIIGGALPGGFTLNPSTGTISGTPKVAGKFTFNVRASDSASHTATRVLSITINNQGPALAITTTALPNGTATAPYSATVSATGGTPAYTWSLFSGALPAGLTIDPATGTISGTPTTAGTANFSVRAQDSSAPQQSVTQPLSITINPASSGPLTIATTSLPPATNGSPYSTTVVATGGTTPYTWSVAAGALPPGLSLNPATGVISGTPTTTASFKVMIKVADSAAATATQPYVLTVN